MEIGDTNSSVASILSRLKSYGAQHSQENWKEPFYDYRHEENGYFRIASISQSDCAADSDKVVMSEKYPDEAGGTENNSTFTFGHYQRWLRILR